MRRSASRGPRAKSAGPTSLHRASMVERRKRDAVASNLDDVTLLQRVTDGDAFSRGNRFGVGRGSGAVKRSRSVLRGVGILPIGPVVRASFGDVLRSHVVSGKVRRATLYCRGAALYAAT